MGRQDETKRHEMFDQRHEGGKSSFHKSAVHKRVHVYKTHHNGERIELRKGEQHFFMLALFTAKSTR
jgi:hypothetical protein